MDKMQYTRMGKRADDVEEMTEKRGDKIQYTRMGKREDENSDVIKDLFLTGNDDDDLDEVEETMMKWGLLGKRDGNLNKMQITRMGKRDGVDKLQYTRMGKRESGKVFVPQ